jgi:hypothetical protein
VAAVFLVGCAVGGVSSQLVVPKASAQQSSPITRWEYRCMTDGWEAVRTAMNGAGAQGWELVSYTTPDAVVALTPSTACFKRPKT